MASLRSMIRPAARAVLARRSTPTISKAALPVLRAVPLAAARSFTSSIPRLASGEKDQALADALAQEQEYEDETSIADSKSLIEKLADGKTWEVSDVPGGDIVTLSRSFGNEKIKITFRISDWADMTPDEVDAEGGMATPEEDMEAMNSLPITIVISKSSAPGSMYIEADAGRQGIEPTNVTVYEKSIAERDGAEAEFERNNSYAGPHHHELDEGLQTAFDGFLEERGVDQALGDFIVSYVELKEQKDYINWLTQVKGFVQA